MALSRRGTRRFTLVDIAGVALQVTMTQLASTAPQDTLVTATRGRELTDRRSYTDAARNHFYMEWFLCFILCSVTVPGTLLDRVVSMGESPAKRAVTSQ